MPSSCLPSSTPRAALRARPLALVAASLCLPGAAWAAGPASAALPAVTVTATLTEQDARPAPASVTVITHEELAERNAADLLDAVRGAPGITLSARQVGGRKTLALRGLEGKHTLTLIDGRRISASDDVIGHWTTSTAGCRSRPSSAWRSSAGRCRPCTARRRWAAC